MRNLLQFITLLMLLGTLAACSTTIGSEVNSVHRINSLTGDYRLVPDKLTSVGRDSEIEVLERFNVLNENYSEGFTKITFSTDEDIEIIIKEKQMGRLAFNLHTCKSDLALYVGSIYRLKAEKDNLYDIFLPMNLDLAIEGYTASRRLDLKEVPLPNDLNELCIKVSAYKLYGEEIKLNLGDIKSLKQRKGSE